MIRTTDDAAEALIAAIDAPASRSCSSLSHSQYIYFSGIPTRLPKSARREFFTRWPKANGAGLSGRFSVRISDHRAVSCREAAMASIDIRRPVEPQIAQILEQVAFLRAHGKEA